MKVRVKGYSYELANVEDPKQGQTLQFIQKEQIEDSTQSTDGTTEEEVVKVLIHRLDFLNKQKSKRETKHALKSAKELQVWLKKINAGTIKRIEKVG